MYPFPKKAAEMLTQKAAMDFDAFYAAQDVKKTVQDSREIPLLILTTDGKGIVMRKEDLREATRKKSRKRKAQTSYVAYKKQTC